MAFKLGTEKLEQCRMKAQSLGNHQTLSAKQNFVKKFVQTWPIRVSGKNNFFEN